MRVTIEFVMIVGSFVAGAMYGRRAEASVYAKMLSEYRKGEETLASIVTRIDAYVMRFKL